MRLSRSCAAWILAALLYAGPTVCLADGEPAPNAGAERGVDGIEFRPVQLDTRTRCSSVILRGLRQNRGTAFVMPRLLISIDKNNEQMFKVIPNGDGTFILDFNIFFPNSDAQLELRKGDSKVYLHGCNFDEVLFQLNKGVKDEAEKTKAFNRVPVKNVTVYLPGFAGIESKYDVTDKKTTILNYQGVDLKVKLPIPDRKTVDRLIERLRDGTGVEVRALLPFNARTSDGATYVEIKLDKVAKSLDFALGGKATIGTAELRGKIASAVSDSFLGVETYAGRSDVHKGITDQIMTLILARFPAQPASAPTPGSPPAGGVPTENNQVKAEGIVEYLRSQETIKYNATSFTLNREEVYSTSVIAHADIEDPDMRTLSARAGEPERYPVNTDAGETLVVIPAGITEQSIGYRPSKRYLTTTQIRDARLADFFPALRSGRFVLRDGELPNGEVAARPMIEGFRDTLRPYYADYRWGVVEFSSYVKSERQVEIDWALEAFLRLPLRIEFAKVGGRKFTPAEILAGNSFWTAEYDSAVGRIEILAKRKLGHAILHWQKEPKLEDTVVRYFFEESPGTFGGRSVSDPQDVRRDGLPTEISKLRVRLLSSADAQERIPQINHREVIGTDGAPAAIIVP